MGTMGAARPERADLASPVSLAMERTPTLSPWVFGILFAALFLSPYWLVTSVVHTLWWEGPGWTNADDVNIGRDFVAFYSAADLTLSGNPPGVYDHETIRAAQQSAIGAPLTFYFPWFYPPPMLMLVAPLGFMHYLVAFAVWCLLPLVWLAAFLRRY